MSMPPATKNYANMTNPEIKVAARAIVRTCRSDDDLRRRLKDELGYPYVLAVTSTRCGQMIMFMVMMWGHNHTVISL